MTVHNDFFSRLFRAAIKWPRPFATSLWRTFYLAMFIYNSSWLPTDKRHEPYHEISVTTEKPYARSAHLALQASSPPDTELASC
jgi:hypothetical protein